MRIYLKRTILCILTICGLFSFIGCGSAVESEPVQVTDLTQISDTMLYATLVNIVNDAPSHIGETIRFSGVAVSEAVNDMVYHAVLVSDVTACCSVGLEYELPEQNYPEDNTAVTVQGVFDTYVDEYDGYTYCVLRNAEIK